MTIFVFFVDAVEVEIFSGKTQIDKFLIRFVLCH